MTSVKLAVLNPRWVGAGGEGVSDKDGNPVPERHGVGLSFDCPCGAKCVRGYVAFRNPLDGGEPYISPNQPTWDRTGDTFETLTLKPSIQRMDNCRWHGFLTDGEMHT